MSLAHKVSASVRLAIAGAVAVIYRLNMHNRSGFFIMRGCAAGNDDVLHPSNAPLADMQTGQGAGVSTSMPAATAAASIFAQ